MAGMFVRFTREMQQKAAAEIAAMIGVDMQMRRSVKNGIRVGFR
jgi:hypothetical protein